MCFEGTALVLDNEEHGRLTVFDQDGAMLHRWSTQTLGMALGTCLEVFPNMAVIGGAASIWKPKQVTSVRQLMLPPDEAGYPFRELKGLEDSSGALGFEAVNDMMFVVKDNAIVLQCIYGTTHGEITLPERVDYTWMVSVPPPDLKAPESAVLSNQEMINGVWVDKTHGWGVKHFHSGARYEGNWWYGERHGIGTYEDETGTYSGEWRGGQRCGHGKHEGCDGSWYCGQWKNDLRDDNTVLAIEVCADASTYKGCWSCGQRHGRGHQYSSNQYSGNWEKGKYHGYGVLHWSDGDVYKGNFVNGVCEGKGTLLSPNKAAYTGLFNRGSFMKRVASERQGSQQPARGPLLPISHPDAEPLWWELFCRLDRDGDGKVQKHELLGYLKSDPMVLETLRLPKELIENAGPWSESVETIYNSINSDESPTLSWPEMKGYFQGQKTVKRPRAATPDSDGWETHVDARGRTFFYHTVTMERRWEKPAAAPKACWRTLNAFLLWCCFVFLVWCCFLP